MIWTYEPRGWLEWRSMVDKSNFCPNSIGHPKQVTFLYNPAILFICVTIEPKTIMLTVKSRRNARKFPKKIANLRFNIASPVQPLQFNVWCTFLWSGQMTVVENWIPDSVDCSLGSAFLIRPYMMTLTRFLIDLFQFKFLCL